MLKKNLRMPLLFLALFSLESFAAPVVLKVEDNEGLSKAQRNVSLKHFIAQNDDAISEAFIRVPKDGDEYSIVQVKRREGGQWQLHGTAFIVADSQLRACLNHTNYFPFNYAYNSSHVSDKKSPLLYLVSNAHVLDPNPSPSRTHYAFIFNYVRTTSSPVRKKSDFLGVGISIPRTDFGSITTHPDIAGEKVDLACFPLNQLFDMASQDPKLAGYKPVFTAVDIQWDMALQEEGEDGSKIWMYGFPGAHMNKSLNLPLRTEGSCSTDPKSLKCEAQKLAGAAQASIIDFKMNITDIGGASGSPVFIYSNFVGRKLVLGVNFAEHYQQIGYATHITRLRHFLSDQTDSIVASPLWPTIINGVAPAQPQAVGVPIGIDPTLTIDKPQPLVIKLETINDLQPILPEVIQELGRGPSILDFSGNDLFDQHVPVILDAINLAGLLNNIVILNISNNRLRDFSPFGPLLTQQNFRFLDITVNSFDLKPLYASLNASDRLKVIGASKGDDFEFIKERAGIELSPEVHREYYRKFGDY